jgi:kynurenine formamidase
VRTAAVPGEAVTVEALDAAIAALDGPLPDAPAILLRTGQEEFDVDDPRFFRYPGMSRAGTLHLAARGAKVLGTDALGWDRPFGDMARAFRATGDRAHLWDGHFAGREREVFIVQQLTNLSALPPTGFDVGCFPIKLARASAAPARVVAFLPASPRSPEVAT